MKPGWIEVSVHHDQIPAHLECQYLISCGIDCEVVGAREYSSIIVGGTVGRFSLWVPADQEKKALDFLAQNQINLVPPADEESRVEPNLKSLKKKAVIWAFMALFLFPILGNVISVRYTKKYFEQSAPSKGLWFFVSFMALAQVPGVLLGLYMIQHLLNGTL